MGVQHGVALADAVNQPTLTQHREVTPQPRPVWRERSLPELLRGLGDPVDGDGRPREHVLEGRILDGPLIGADVVPEAAVAAGVPA